jgi:hypothetical protein
MVLRVRITVLLDGSLRNRRLLDHLFNHRRRNIYLLPYRSSGFLGSLLLLDLMHLESLLYPRLSRLFHLNHHLKLRVIEAPLILTTTLLQEGLLNFVRILLRTFPKLKPILRIIESVAFPTGHALPPG